MDDKATVATTRKPRGFAAMDRTLVREIAQKGGKAAHAAGTAHEFTTEEAREAGRKGGKATHARRGVTGVIHVPRTPPIADLLPESNHPGFEQHEDIT